jgi:hypothetical protein
MPTPYKSFPKSDARRYFAALLSADRLQDRATIHYISLDIGCTRAEVQRALEAAETQFGVVYERAGPVYRIASWGVLKKVELAKLVQSDK